MSTILQAGYELRPARDTDSPALVALVEEVLAAYDMPPDPGHADKAIRDIEVSFRDGFLDVLVSQTSAIVGSVGVLPLGDHRCELVKMFLAPAHRGRGLGKALLAHGTGWARARGFSEMTLETSTRLIEAKRLYEKAGFEVTGDVPATDRCNLVMRLVL